LLAATLLCASPAFADDAIQKRELAAVLRQIDLAERLARGSEAQPMPPEARYHFDYPRLYADLARIRAGIHAVAGLPFAILFSMIAIVPTCVMSGIAPGLFAGGGLLRRLKRGRPETWLYRQLQWWIAFRHPVLAPLREQGVNSHYEMAAAFDAAGFEALKLTVAPGFEQ
jgi:RAQPRD family integrative conjugative element protein